MTNNILENLLNELQRLKTSHELLEDVYSEIGPYKDREVSDKTWSKVRDHFDFDDSE